MKNTADQQTKNREETERRLLTAAATTFSTRGYDGCNVRNIAEEAGVNVSLINRYFGGKEGLLEAVIGQLLEQKQNAELGYPPQATLRDEIFEYLEFRLRVDIDNDQLNRILISKVATDRSFRDKIMTMVMSGADRNMFDRLQRLQVNGQIPESEEIEQIFVAISNFSFSANFLGYAIMGRSRRATLKDFDAFARTFAKGMAG